MRNLRAVVAATALLVAQVCVLLLLWSPTTGAVPTGAKMTLLSSGINHVATQVLPYIVEQVKTTPIPDQHGSTSVSILGTIDYDVTSIHIGTFTVGSLTVATSSSQDFSASVGGVGITVHFNWHWRMKSWPHTSDSGNADGSTSGSSVQATVHISLQNGKPVLSTASTTVNLNNFNINVHSGWTEWLYDLLISLFNGSIRDSIKSSLRDSIRDAINKAANEAIESVDFVQKVDSTSEVDFSLTSQALTDKYLSFGSKGEFYWQNHHSECPAPAASMPDAFNGEMVQTMLSDFVANSAAYTYYQAGQLQYLLTSADVPPNSPIKLNTTSFRFIIPQLYQQFPNCAMQVLLEATQPPTTQIRNSGILAQIIGAMDVEVIQPNGTVFSAFTIAVQVATAGKVGVVPKQSENIITGELEYLNLTMKLAHSNIGNININILNTLVEALVKGMVVPYLNQYLAAGFPIPHVDGVTWLNPQIALQDGYVVISTDIDYKPPGLQKLLMKQNHKSVDIDIRP